MSTSETAFGCSSIPDRQFVKGLFDWLAPNYDRAVLTYSLAQDIRWKAEMVRRLRPRPGETALDLACGTGLIVDRLARKLGPDSVVGLDINRTMLTRKGAGRPARRLVVGDSVRLPFRDAAFDVVTAGYLFKYVPLNELSQEVRRVLRPGGRLGGYDFSAPIRTTTEGWVYEQYLHRVLPLLGRRRGRVEAEWDSLFRFLASIASSSGWETRVESAFLDRGFDRVLRIPSLGGAITWFWAWAGDICSAGT